MSAENPLLEVVRRYKNGELIGAPSICSSNEFVLKATFKVAVEMNSPFVLIEATSNQVNQFGGYTGLTPSDFYVLVQKTAKQYGFPLDRVVVGGDHYGPLPWTKLPPDKAMELSKQLVIEAVKASFRKLHIDTTVPLATDKEPLSSDVIFTRTVELIAAAEEAYEKSGRNDSPIVYVIGSDVPTAGGKLKNSEEVTEPEKLREDLELFREKITERGLSDIWKRVIAVVIKHGAEFEHDKILPYRHEKVRELKEVIKAYPHIVFEGHSTDYQPYAVLKQMVEDGIVILKVGPALTFALREALMSLSMIEEEIYRSILPQKVSRFRSVLEENMLQDPTHWSKYYSPKDPNLRQKLLFSFYDRSRYYLANPRVSHSIDVLFENLKKSSIPLPLLSQYMPTQFSKVIEGKMQLEPESLVLDKISEKLTPYFSLILTSKKTPS
ncbi:class II D-tagatose-bisphosphate aldolase, non-catalytic subunit [Infirmifilum sp. NZ]|uniref:class II D-tagatose-bisphosphate aldolase, non-catalytic subunit n=1 Tax=Infirmifilum sp. NZ TaxID=2926850 RepID=UPI0027A8D50B|nr:class II D-tagatose-bisphosphate aldolase, non-catalytic subunit [Infirmifilum sp. NZ]UNQ73214.1 class II D-tagatose-bisphosphate aldolase, non-catalytic subunit [Infirmifilum sp. NZ]